MTNPDRHFVSSCRWKYVLSGGEVAVSFNYKFLSVSVTYKNAVLSMVSDPDKADIGIFLF